MATSRRSNSSMSNTKPDSASFSSPKLSQPPVPSPSSSRHSNGHHGQQGRGKDGAARNPPSHKHTRQSNRGKQNNSNQRSAATSADDESATDSQATLLSTPTKKPGRAARKQAKLQQAPPKIALLTRTAPEGEQQDLLARFASPQTPVQVPATVGGRSSGKRNRRPQDSPPRSDDAVVRTPSRRPNKQQFQPNPQQQSQARTVSGGPATIYSPTPRAGHVVASPHTVVPGRGGSPGVNRSNHYAGASFNNSPAPATLPLPPSFLISPSSASSPPPSFHVPVLAHSPSPSAPVSNRNSSLFVRDEDVFDMAVSAPVSADRILSQQQQQFMSYHNQVSAVLSERSRQLEHMLASGGARPNQHLNHGGLSDTLDLAQPATDMTSMFQKLRLMKEMSQNRPATVEPMAHHQLTPV